MVGIARNGVISQTSWWHTYIIIRVDIGFLTLGAMAIAVQMMACSTMQGFVIWWCNVKGQNTIGWLDQYTAPNNEYAVPHQSHLTSSKGLLPVAHPILLLHETATPWNSPWQGVVTMPVPRIGSLLPPAVNSHKCGHLKLGDGLT